jgi:hypothetical protein
MSTVYPRGVLHVVGGEQKVGRALQAECPNLMFSPYSLLPTAYSSVLSVQPRTVTLLDSLGSSLYLLPTARRNETRTPSERHGGHHSGTRPRMTPISFAVLHAHRPKA